MHLFSNFPHFPATKRTQCRSKEGCCCKSNPQRIVSRPRGLQNWAAPAKEEKLCDEEGGGRSKVLVVAGLKPGHLGSRSRNAELAQQVLAQDTGSPQHGPAPVLQFCLLVPDLPPPGSEHVFSSCQGHAKLVPLHKPTHVSVHLPLKGEPHRTTAERTVHVLSILDCYQTPSTSCRPLSARHFFPAKTNARQSTPSISMSSQRKNQHRPNFSRPPPVFLLHKTSANYFG